MLLSRVITSVAVAAAMLINALPFTTLAADKNTAETLSYPEGFVYANGTKFMCDGSPYYYGGTNCYYLTFKSKNSVDNVFEDAENMGLKVIRVWGNLDVGVKTDKINPENGAPVFTNNNDGPGEKDGIYFQYFDKQKNRPVVNEGADGIQKLDYAIAQAEKHDMKLLITFTNYWDAFGGMGQYVDWAEEIGITGLKKDDFYTNKQLKTWYKDYIKTLLNHENVYTGRKLKDEPGVFAWELSNEPRCNSDAQCKNDILYNWAKEMSEYVKSIDPYHMVALGDEGFFNKPYGYYNDYTTSNYAFYGAEGVDFEKLMTIDTLDFGTPHLYLDQWGMKHTGSGQDDLLWFRIHGETCADLNKPVILEEFGLTNRSIRDSEYEQWFEVLEGNVYDNVEYAGTNYWMIASYVDGTLYPDYDQYTVYGPEGLETETTRQLIMKHAEKMSKKNIVNTVNPSSASFDRSTPNDLKFTTSFKMGSFSGLECNGTKLVSGTDYIFNNGVITLKGSYLAKQELSKYTFKVLATAGNSPKFTVVVSDSSIPKPEISPKFATTDINPRVCKDITIKMDTKTSEFRGIMLDGKYLNNGTDYTVSGSTVTIKKSFIKTLSTGTASLVFDFYEGEDCEFTLTVADTTGLDEFDTFESYSSDSDLWKSYSSNPNGNKMGLALANKNESQALAFTYDIGSPNGYCGVNHPIAKRDMSSFTGVQLWVEGDGSGNSLTLQLRDANNKYFETQIKLDFTSGKTIKIPFSEFKAPSWQSGGSLDTTSIDQFSLYGGDGGNTTKGTIYIDDIIIYNNEEVLNVPHLTENSATFDGNNPESILTKLILFGASIDSIKCANQKLTANVDYSWNGSQVMINTSYLNTLKNGTYNLVYNFSDGNSDTFTVTVVNSKVGSEHNHSYVGKITKNATCTQDGEKLYTCSCGNSYSEKIPATGHKMTTEKADATCTTDGYIKHTCSVCDYNYSETISATGHKMTTEKVDATCTKDGYVKETCSACGHSYSKIIAATGHNYVATSEKPNCTTGGRTTYVCTKCGDSYTETIPASGHKYETKVTAPTCTTDGYTTHVCKVCGDSYKDSYVKAAGHSYDSKVTAPTCTTDGYTTHVCKVCGYTHTDSYVKAAGHKYTDEVVAPTETEKGYTIHTCTVCGDSYKDNYVEPTKPGKQESIEYFKGLATCGTWGQAIYLDAAKNGGKVNPADFKKDGYLYAEFEGNKDEVEIILQSWSGGSNWLRIQPTETGKCDSGYYAKWSYNTITSAYGNNLMSIDKLLVGIRNGNLTLKLFSYVNSDSIGGSGNQGGSTTDPTPVPTYKEYFNGSASCGAWGQAIGLTTTKNGGSFNVSDIEKDGYFYAEYTESEKSIELILQSWSGGAGWLRIQPTETGKGPNGYYAKWSYDSIVAAYGNNFSTIDKIYIGTSNSSICLNKLQYAK